MNLTEHAQRIKKFMQLAGQELPDKPVMPDEDTRRLRAKLIIEEAFETVEALGFAANMRSLGLYPFEPSEIVLTPNGRESIIEIADGCGDLSVVSIGTLLAFGIPDKPVLEAIDESNMRKFGEGGYRRDDGKWVKPPNWIPPNLEAAIYG